MASKNTISDHASPHHKCPDHDGSDYRAADDSRSFNDFSHYPEPYNDCSDHGGSAHCSTSHRSSFYSSHGCVR